MSRPGKPPASAPLVLPAPRIRSLAWRGDTLIDWVGGGDGYGLDGSTQSAGASFSYRFDSAVTNRAGDVAVVFERYGTKGVVASSDEVFREINRSYYRAEDYFYPVCLWDAAAGRTLLAHCPEEYNRIEIEDAITGERLTASADREPCDFFHSCLQANPAGTRLLSAGWVWHPINVVAIFDIALAIREPGTLDEIEGYTDDDDDDDSQNRESTADEAGMGEQYSTCWQTDDRALISCDFWNANDGARKAGKTMKSPVGVVVYEIPTGRCVQTVDLGRTAGIMMPVGDDRFVSFRGHPRLISLADGSVIAEWPDLPTEDLSSCFSERRDNLPSPLALDPVNHRFAVFRDDAIHVVAV